MEHQVPAIRAALVATAIVIAARSGAAQAPGVWGDEHPPKLGPMSAAERAIATSTINELERILRQIPELAAPRGFEVRRQVFGASLPLGDQGVLEYEFNLWFAAPSFAATMNEGPRCIEVRVNHPSGNHPGYRNLQDAEGRELLIEDEVGEPVPGATIVYDGLRFNTPEADRRSGFVIFTTRGAHPWKAVTREEFLRARLFAIAGPQGDAETSVRKSLEKTTYERWLDEAPHRKKTREEAVAAIAASSGRAVADEQRKNMEQVERDVTEQLKAQDAEERSRNKEVLATPTAGAALRAEMEAMSPVERASPAMVDISGLLVAADDPRAHKVITPDPAFWRVRRSRAEVHSITVAFHPFATCEKPAVRAALEKALQSLDWAAIKRLADAPP